MEVQEGARTHADLDPVQRLFLEKIREYDNMSRLSGEPVEMDPDYEKSLSEETAKLQRLYGGGDLNSFPEFTFTEPTLDQDSNDPPAAALPLTFSSVLVSVLHPLKNRENERGGSISSVLCFFFFLA
ncbi:ATP synthase-coupling factor 6, mitochondrial [Scomber japonicus]|uniref:ATP synthase-coupling factor 6, mitochondrial n=1 Tax=Scomber japonicus TaxID=13676 RepID=UPI002305EFE8|nr:ATP synthase-coupling factor 6, mitochondrial [Scomber japonicus]